MAYYVYILECSDRTLYVGVTNNLERRLLEHQKGKSNTSYTYNRRPVKLIWSEIFQDISYAIKVEKKLKKWSKAKKIALSEGDWNNLVDLAKKKF